LSPTAIVEKRLWDDPKTVARPDAAPTVLHTVNRAGGRDNMPPGTGWEGATARKPVFSGRVGSVARIGRVFHPRFTSIRYPCHSVSTQKPSSFGEATGRLRVLLTALPRGVAERLL